MWRSIYWAKLPGLTRKFRVAIDWLLSLILPRDLAQLNVSPSESITRQHFEAGEVVFRQGDVGDRMYVVIDGELEVVYQPPEGTERVLAKLKEGEWFGEMALFNDEPRGATIRTVTNVNALSLDRSAFQVLVSYLPPLHEIIQRTVQERAAQNRAHQNPEWDSGKTAATVSQPS
jgi:NADH:ubiquinone reductase (H+-translocating)